MKKNILLFLILLTPFILKAQMPTIVNDPTNLAKISEVLQTGQKQIQRIQEQTKLLKDAKDKVETVNKEIHKIKVLKSALDQQVKLLEYFKKDFQKVSSDPVSDKAYLSYINLIKEYRGKVLDNNNLLLQLFSDNKFNMSDYERIQMANDIINENYAIFHKAQEEKEYYEEMNERLKILISLKNK